ncbi:UNVERIFIED_CONTAM: hypothetical protein GTU68_001722 [Idotea baltica]|nr:hypothetical protein [Idotea baltica]
MTTTAASQYCNILHDLAPPIVIIEEAAEILEAHVISSLSVKCQHLIMIGDHKQLRPKSNVFELSQKYNLDTSLFERMINNGIKYEVLEYQHRMKPLISDLLVPYIYKDLKDHSSVFQYPKIEGVAKDLFFIDHKEMESEPSDGSESFENHHEAEFLLALCRHLVFNGYTQCDVTIITPYSGQYRCIKKLQRTPEFDLCQGVRVSILDNYQGEESNIILLSLVRSNAEGKVGFLRIDNRVCVALSRARYGMYIIGNMTQMLQAKFPVDCH